MKTLQHQYWSAPDRTIQQGSKKCIDLQAEADQGKCFSIAWRECLHCSHSYRRIVNLSSEHSIPFHKAQYYVHRKEECELKMVRLLTIFEFYLYARICQERKDRNKRSSPTWNICHMPQLQLLSVRFRSWELFMPIFPTLLESLLGDILNSVNAGFGLIILIGFLCGACQPFHRAEERDLATAIQVTVPFSPF